MGAGERGGGHSEDKFHQPNLRPPACVDAPSEQTRVLL